MNEATHAQTHTHARAHSSTHMQIVALVMQKKTDTETKMQKKKNKFRKIKQMEVEKRIGKKSIFKIQINPLTDQKETIQRQKGKVALGVVSELGPFNLILK